MTNARLRTVVLLNAHARKGKTYLSRVESYFKNDQKRFDILGIVTIKQDDEFDACLKKLKSYTKAECIIVGSGDGTIVAVLNCLKDRKNLIYGFIPLGTSNVFVRSLGSPIEIKKSLKLLQEGTPVDVSLGNINGKLFANSAGSGVPVKVVQNLTNQSKKLLGPLSYILVGLQEFIKHNAFLCIIEHDGKKREFYTHHLLIANGKFHGLIPVGQNTSLHDDSLTIFAFGTTKDRWDYAKSILKFGLGKNKIAKTTLVFSTKKLKLTTRPKRTIEADGEPIGKTPATIQIKPNAIKVIS